MVIAPTTVNGLLTVNVTVVALPMVRLAQDKPVVFIVGLVPIKTETPIWAASPAPGYPVAGDQLPLLFQLVLRPRPVQL